jgi:hypothetical protein
MTMPKVGEVYWSGIIHDGCKMELFKVEVTGVEGYAVRLEKLDRSWRTVTLCGGTDELAKTRADVVEGFRRHRVMEAEALQRKWDEIRADVAFLASRVRELDEEGDPV